MTGAPGRGIVYLVGAGPGDPDLMTVRGLRCLQRAEVLIHDRLVSPEILAAAPPRALRIDVGKEAGNHRCPQEEINDLLVRHARAGRVVVRLKGGDPFVFGRGAEEALACAEAGVAWEVIPGVTSAVSVPARAGIPVTHRGTATSFAVVTGHCLGDDRVDWDALSRVDTLLILMGLTRLGEVTSRLMAHGRPADTPAAVVSRGTLPDERVLVSSLGEIAGVARAAELPTPAMVVVGEVVKLRERLAKGLAEGWALPSDTMAPACRPVARAPLPEPLILVRHTHRRHRRPAERRQVDSLQSPGGSAAGDRP